MRAVEAQYRELAELREFFQGWWGRGWEAWLINAGMVYRGQVADTLAKRTVFSARILPRLRAVRDLLNAGVQRDRIAKRPRMREHKQREFVGLDVTHKQSVADDAQHALG